VIGFIQRFADDLPEVSQPGVFADFCRYKKSDEKITIKIFLPKHRDQDDFK